jgi:hypothetical protein
MLKAKILLIIAANRHHKMLIYQINFGAHGALWPKYTNGACVFAKQSAGIAHFNRR